MSRNTKPALIVDRVGILTATFTAAVTDICTANAHGLKNGDKLILTTAGTLPAGLALATVYYVIEVTTNTFKLSLTAPPNDYTTGAAASSPVPVVDITDTGTGAHTFTMHDIGNNIDVSDYRHCIIAVHGAASCNIDIGVVGSIGKGVDDDDAPDFSAAAAYNNSWDYIEIIGLINGTAVDGSAAQISQTGTNKHELHELNINGLKWINIRMSGWSAGSVTVFALLFND